MKNALFLAWHSLLWNRGRSLIIVLSLAITIWVPVTVRLALDQFQQEITSRARSTPLVIGARGSQIDLVLHALYFRSQPPSETTMEEVDTVNGMSLGVAIPLHVRHRTQSRPGIDGVPIVGTSPEYFEFRQLTLGSGELITMLGECVVGASVAERMQLKPGDAIFSAPRNAFNLAGDYPLKLTVSGVLNRSHSPDDDCVFADVQTTWIIDGIGHGHQEVNRETDASLRLESDEENSVTANAGVLPYTEITEDNVDSFHFHGDPKTFPLTAVLVDPTDEKSRVRILGRYAGSSAAAQCLKPPDVIEELLRIVFRIEQLVWMCSLAAAFVTGLLLALVLSLSMRLRANEMQTMFRLGCSRLTIAGLQAAEILITLFAAAGLALVASWLTISWGSDAIRQMIF
jgi:putative ABC transport system permease protein